MLPSTKHAQVNDVLQLYIDETQPFRKIHRMIDLSEVIIKTHTAYLISYYLQIGRKNNEINGMLVGALRTPSLGIWQEMSRTIFAELVMNQLSGEEWVAINGLITKKDVKDIFTEMYNQHGRFMVIKPGVSRAVMPGSAFKYMLAIRENTFRKNSVYLENFLSYFYEWDRSVGDMISLRNQYAHGATPSDEECSSMIAKHEPILAKWLASDLLQKTSVTIGEQVSGEISDIPIKAKHPYLLVRGQGLELFPIIQYKQSHKQQEEYRYFFFNDLKKSKSKRIAYLNYPLAENMLDKEIYEKFIQYIDLENWGKHYSGEFKERIESLKESFKGRFEELERVEEWAAARSKGFLAIKGSPGIGKSALMASLHLDPKKYYSVKYFFRRGTVFADPDYFLDYLNKELESSFKTEVPTGGKLEDKHIHFVKRLQKISEKIQNKKVVLILDGIDELDTQLQRILLSTELQHILVVYTSRKTPQTTSFYDSLPIEHTKSLELGGLRKEDVRALLYEVVNKYELEQEYVETVVTKSQGNPLYLKLLCDALLNKEITINDERQLPEKLEAFYKRLIHRFSKQIHGTEISTLIHLFAASKDYLSLEQMRNITGYEIQVLVHAYEVLEEVLIVKEGTYPTYQLFHESFREYLMTHYPTSIRDAQTLLIKYCLQWADHTAGNELRSYAFHYLSKHLVEIENFEALGELTKDESFVQQQIQFTKHYQSSFQLYQDAMTMALQVKQMDSFIDLCGKAMVLQEKMSHSTKEIVPLIERGGYTNIELAVSRISLYSLREKSAFLTYILYSLCEDRIPNLHNEDQKKVIELVENICKTEPFIWNLVHLQPIFYIIHTLKLRQVPYSFIIKSINFESISYRDFEEFLSSVEWEDQKKVDIINEMVVEMDDHRKAGSWLTIATLIRKAGKLDDSRTYLEKTLAFLPHIEKEIMFHTTHLLDEMVEHDLYDKAISFARETDGIFSSVYGMIANKMCKDNRIKEAILFLYALEQDPFPLKHGQVERESAISSIYEAIASHYRSLGEIETAIDYIKKIPLPGIQSRYIKFYFDEMVEKDLSAAEKIAREFPDVVYAAKLKQLYAADKNDRLAEEWGRKIDEMLFAGMGKIEQITNLKEKELAIHSAAVDLTYAERVDDALLLVKTEAPYIVKKDRILRDLAIISYRLHGLAAGEHVIHEIERDWEKMEAYSGIAQSSLKNKNLEECKEMIEQIPFPEYKKVIYTNVLAHYIKGSQADEAFAYLSFIEDKIEDCNRIYYDIVKEFVSNGYVKQGLELRKKITWEKDYRESLELHRFLVNHFWNNESKDEAVRLLIKLEGHNQKATRAILGNTKQLLQVGDYLYQQDRQAEFINLFHAVEDISVKLELIGKMNKNHAEFFSGQIIDLIQMADFLPVREKTTALIKLGKLCITFNQDLKLFFEVLQLAEHSVIQLDDDWSQAISWEAYRQIIELYLCVGEVEKSLAIVNRQQMYINQIQGLVAIVQFQEYQDTQHKMELLDQACQLLQKEERKFSGMVDIYISQIISAFLYLDEIDKAAILIKDIRERTLLKHDYYFLETILDALLYQDQLVIVEEILSNIQDDDGALLLKDLKMALYYFERGLTDNGDIFFQQAISRRIELNEFGTPFLAVIGLLFNENKGEWLARYIGMMHDVDVRAACYLELAYQSIEMELHQDAASHIDTALGIIDNEGDEYTLGEWVKKIVKFPLSNKQCDRLFKQVQRMNDQENAAACIKELFVNGPEWLSIKCLEYGVEKLSFSNQKQLFGSLVVQMDPANIKKVEVLMEFTPLFLNERKLLEEMLFLYSCSEVIKGKEEHLKGINEIIDITCLLNEDSNQLNLYSLENLHEWIDTIEDLDQKLEIQVLANAVKKGRMEPEDFEQYMRKNL